MLKWRLIIRNGRGPLVNRQIKGLRLLLRATVRRWLLLNFIQVRCPRLSCVTRADAEPKLLWSPNCVKPRKNKNTAFVFFFYSSARNRSLVLFPPVIISSPAMGTKAVILFLRRQRLLTQKEKRSNCNIPPLRKLAYITSLRAAERTYTFHQRGTMTTSLEKVDGIVRQWPDSVLTGR